MSRATRSTLFLTVFAFGAGLLAGGILATLTLETQPAKPGIHSQATIPIVSVTPAEFNAYTATICPKAGIPQKVTGDIALHSEILKCLIVAAQDSNRRRTR